MIDLVKKSTPAVVSIVVTQNIKVSQGRSPFEDFFDDPFFRQFFENFNIQPVPPTNETQKRQVSAGTGFVVSSEGLILTNKHVVDFGNGDTEFLVTMYNGEKYPAAVLAKDPVLDLAVLKINASGLSVLPLGDSSKLQIGQTVIAIGNALGEFSNTISKGVISGLSRSIVASSGFSSERLSEVIQTDAAINPGNSGGPLLNVRGEVIGVNTAIAQGAQNIGFAIPVNQAKKAVDDVKTIGRIVYPFLGVRYMVITPEIQKLRNLKVDYGALVVKGEKKNEPAVTPGSPAEIAGIKEGDIILEMVGQKLAGKTDLAKAIQVKKVGDVVKIKILRNDKEIILDVKLAERQ